jgi:transcriptional regulator with XRE-family HTH domain
VRDQLKQKRKAKGITQSQMAKNIGTTIKHISDIETGRCGCSFEVAQKISSILLYDLDPSGIMLTAYDGVNRLSIDKVKQLAKKFNVEFDNKNLFGE